MPALKSSWSFLPFGTGPLPCCVYHSLEFFTFKSEQSVHITEVVPLKYTWLLMKVVFCENSEKASLSVAIEFLKVKGKGGQSWSRCVASRYGGLKHQLCFCSLQRLRVTNSDWKCWYKAIRNTIRLVQRNCGFCSYFYPVKPQFLLHQPNTLLTVVYLIHD